MCFLLIELTGLSTYYGLEYSTFCVTSVIGLGLLGFLGLAPQRFLAALRPLFGLRRPNRLRASTSSFNWALVRASPFLGMRHVQMRWYTA